MANARINQQNSRNYWQGVNADVDGMLGGFAFISDKDLQGSKSFLVSLNVLDMNREKKLNRAVDCGAGYVYEIKLFKEKSTRDFFLPRLWRMDFKRQNNVQA